MAKIPYITTLPRGRYIGRLTADYDKTENAIRGGLAIEDLNTGKVISSREIIIPIAQIHEAVQSALMATRPPQAQLSGDLYELSGWWSDVKKKARGIAKQVGAKKLLRVANRIMNDPRFAQGTAFAGMFVPGLDMTVNQIRTANTMLLKASGGDPASVAKVASIVEQAKAGSSSAQKVASAFIALKQAHNEGKADPVSHVCASNNAELAGWAYNRPYRSNLQAGQLDKTPGNLLRALYHSAINR